MKNIQNTLSAMAIFAGILAGSTFAEETQKAVGNTANNAGKVTQVSPTMSQILGISALEFKKKGDIEKLVEEAKKLGLEVKEKIDDEKKFETLKKQIVFENALKIDVSEWEYTPENVAKLDELAEIFGVEKVDVSKKIHFARFRTRIDGVIQVARLEEERKRYQEEGESADKRRAELEEEGNRYQAESDRLKAEAEKLRQKANATLAEIKSNLQKEVKKDINKK